MRKKKSVSKPWLDDSGRFLFGMYKGKLAEDVAKSDRGYVRWIVDSVEDCDEGDREILSALVARG